MRKFRRAAPDGLFACMKIDAAIKFELSVVNLCNIGVQVPGRTEALMETLEEKIARVVKEEVAVTPYDPRWPEIFEQERRHLLSCLPADLVKRIEHFGSTAIPGISAKPIVDMPGRGHQP